jgi:site-specific DNA recombinase
MIFQLSAKEGWSCMAIAKHLTTLGVPPSYTKDGRKLKRGKRRENTAGLWGPGRIRNIIVNPTYRGLHRYGQRSKRQREVIERRVPAIVDEETWERAQKTLRKNRADATRNTRRRYLLRTLMRCEVCGCTYCGSNDRGRVYYICTGKRGGRGPYAKLKQRCPSRCVPGSIEDTVWADIEEFLRNPGDVLDALAQKLENLDDDGFERRKNAEVIEAQLAGKDTERDRVLTLYRRGTIDAKLLDRQMAEIERERGELTEALKAARERLDSLQEATSRIDSAEALLRELNGRLDEPITWELKREIVETLVECIRVDTVEENGRKEAVVHVTYNFDPPHSGIDTRTDRDSSTPRRTVPTPH